MFDFLPEMGLDGYNRLMNGMEPSMQSMPWLGAQDPTLQGPAAQVQQQANPLAQMGLLGGMMGGQQEQPQTPPRPQPMPAMPVGQAAPKFNPRPIPAANYGNRGSRMGGMLSGYL